MANTSTNPSSPLETLMGAQFSTYRIGGPLEEAYQPTSMEEALAVLERVKQTGKSLTVLGGGSNSLIASKGIPGITLITKKMTWIEEKGENRFLFGSGVHLAKAAKVAQQHSLSGAEFMIGIPGTIGGAVRMNAGALGQEMKNVVRYVFLYNLEHETMEIWEPEKLGFDYRKSTINPKQQIILGAELEFQPGESKAITEMMEGNIQFRKTHHPTDPNGGSVFQNPSKEMTVGWMLDQCGAKGWTEGGVQISPLHANFIVNINQGTSTDVLRLMARMKRAIQERYGHIVHPENLFVGAATSEEQALWKELTGEQPST